MRRATPAGSPEPRPARGSRFGPFELDLEAGELRRKGVPVKLPPQAFAVLALLAGRPGELVTRAQLCTRVWGSETFVDFEQGLGKCIYLIRERLGDDPRSPRFIETLPTRGYRFIAPVEPQSRRIVLVVLPFQNLTGDPSRECFSDGLTEEIIGRLARLDPHEVGVIARWTAMTYKNSSSSIGEIGAELGADYVVEGSVRLQEDRVRVAAQLIQARDQCYAWAAVFDRTLHGALELQCLLGAAIARAIRMHLPSRGPPAGRAGSNGPGGDRSPRYRRPDRR